MCDLDDHNPMILVSPFVGVLSETYLLSFVEREMVPGHRHHWRRILVSAEECVERGLAGIDLFIRWFAVLRILCIAVSSLLCLSRIPAIGNCLHQPLELLGSDSPGSWTGECIGHCTSLSH